MNGSDTRAVETLVAGKITGCYGVKGWVKVHSYTEPMENFLAMGEWMLQRRQGLEPIEFDAGRRQGKGLVAHITGVDDRTAAEAFRGAGSGGCRDTACRPWNREITTGTSCRVCRSGAPRAKAGLLLGTVDCLLETGANDVLVVAACEGSLDGRERLIPYLPGDVVTRVDEASATIEVDWFQDA